MKKSSAAPPALDDLTVGRWFGGRRFLVRSSRVCRTRHGEPYLEMHVADGVMNRTARRFQATREEQGLKLDQAWITASGRVGTGRLARDLVIHDFVLLAGAAEPERSDRGAMPDAACAALCVEMAKVAAAVRDSGLSSQDADELLQCEFAEAALRRSLERMYCLGHDDGTKS